MKIYFMPNLPEGLVIPTNPAETKLKDIELISISAECIPDASGVTIKLDVEIRSEGGYIFPGGSPTTSGARQVFFPLKTSAGKKLIKDISIIDEFEYLQVTPSDPFQQSVNLKITGGKKNWG